MDNTDTLSVKLIVKPKLLSDYKLIQYQSILEGKLNFKNQIGSNIKVAIDDIQWLEFMDFQETKRILVNG